MNFLVLLISLFTFNNTNNSNLVNFDSDTLLPQEIQIVFSQGPIGFEGGQPVYPDKTKIIVKSPYNNDLKIIVNGGKEISEKSSEVDITNHFNGKVGTHTVLVVTKDNHNKSIKKIFGFSTK